jgi:hypothetical protein
MVTAVIWIVLGLLSDLTFAEIVYQSLAVTIIAYIVGDLIILNLSNNTIATVADIGLALVIIYFANYLWIEKDVSFTDALITSIVIGVGEWFFHKYVYKNVFPETKIED